MGPDQNAYPITGTSYALVYAKQTDPAKAAALINFLAWTLTDGQDLASRGSTTPRSGARTSSSFPTRS